MARVVLALPEVFRFAMEITVHISEINWANHVGADGIMSLIQEARIGFLKKMGYKELEIEGYGIIIADSVVVFKSEAFHGEVLIAEVDVNDFNKYGCDIVYRLSKADSGQEVARAKTGILFFDYTKREKAVVPKRFLENIAGHGGLNH